MSCPSHLRLDHSNYIWESVQFMKLLITPCSRTSCHFTPLSLQIFSFASYSQIPFRLEMLLYTTWRSNIIHTLPFMFSP
jgi:hypothetical protein